MKKISIDNLTPEQEEKFQMEHSMGDMLETYEYWLANLTQEELKNILEK